MKILFLSLLMVGFVARADSVASTTLGKLSKMDGAAFQTDKDKVLLYFWASWCEDCKEKLHKGMAGFPSSKDSELVTVNMDKDLARAKHFIEHEGVSVPVWRDSDKSVVAQLKVFSVPSWAVLARKSDGNWTVVNSEAGGNAEKMQAALNSSVER